MKRRTTSSALRAAVSQGTNDASVPWSEWTLKVLQALSAIAVPVVLGLLGWRVQQTLAEAGLKKDYVQIAIAVLREKPEGQESEQLRSWAIAVLEKNSPVELPAKLKSALIERRLHAAGYRELNSYEPGVAWRGNDFPTDDSEAKARTLLEDKGYVVTPPKGSVAK